MFKAKLFIKTVRFTALVAGLILLLKYGQSKYPISSFVWLCLAYYALLSMVTGLITASGMTKDNKTFMSRTYSAIGIRLVFSVFPLLIYVLFMPVKDIPLIVIYILLYFLYTSFEIYMLVVNLRPDFKK